MINMTLAEASIILKLNHPITNTSFRGISIDTRTLQKDNLFVAIKGSRVDGHDFIQEAYQKGAALALVSHPVNSPLLTLEVKDPIFSLGQLTAAWRQQFSIPFIAVTGSNGKTTLKNMIAAILIAASKKEEVLFTQGTLNNHIGLPLTLARLNQQHRYAVIEIGMNHFGEIETLAQLAKPTVAVITNAAASHLENLGDIAGVARAKAEIFKGLTKQGIAVFNRDDAFFNFWRDQWGARPSLTFGFHQDADITGIIHETKLTQYMTLSTPEGSIDIRLPLLGKHNILNALAAAAATLAIGIKLDAIKQGLESTEAAPGRLQLHTLANGVNIIDDTYNSNPFSLQAALDTLTAFAGEKILVLGDMKELGIEAKLFHTKAGEKIRAAGIQHLFTYGELSASTTQSFGQGASHFNNQEKLVHALKPFLHQEATILVKGSRSMHMEKIIAELVQ